MGLLNAMYVKKCFPFPVYLEDIKHLMLERRSPMNVNNAINGLVPTLHFKITEEVIMGKSPMAVNSVVKLSVVPVTFENMNELMLGKNPVHANSVVSASVLPVLFRYTKEFILEKKPYKCEQGARAFSCSTSIRKQEQIHSGEKSYKLVWESLCFQLELITNSLISYSLQSYECKF